MDTTTTMRKVVAAAFSTALLLTPIACSDEDGDGATTDEEIEDIKDGADEVDDRVDQEVDGQDTGTNEDGE
jgi:hypothetical protein